MKIKIGMVNYSINMLDHWVALDLGLCRDERLEVELIGSQPTSPAGDRVLQEAYQGARDKGQGP